MYSDIGVSLQYAWEETKKIYESIEIKVLLIIQTTLFLLTLTGIPFAFFVPRKLLPILTVFFQGVLWPLFRYIFWKYGRLEIYGTENLKKQKGAAIFAINHSSKWDPILIAATIGFVNLIKRFGMHYASRKRSDSPGFYEAPKYLIWLFGGLVFKVFGAYPLYPKMEGYAQKMKEHVRLLLAGHNVCIYPEGDRKEGKELGKGKPGVAYLLWKTGKPVIPVAIHGHVRMEPSSLFSRKHRIVVSYGAPVTKEEMFPDSVMEPSHDELIRVSQVIMGRIRHLLITSGYEVEEMASVFQPSVAE